MKNPDLPDQPEPPDVAPRTPPVVVELSREGVQHTHACRECPFIRNVTDEVLIKGGSPPEVYIGQAWGPFLLSCHMDPSYDPHNPTTQVLQCAGAAVFRANTGRDKLLPASLLHAEADTNSVFADAAELLAHHRHIPLEEAEEFLSITSEDDLLQIEFRRARTSSKAKTILTPKKE